MDIYIQSRGKVQDSDYKWVRIDSEGQYRKDPPIRDEIQILVESQSVSLSLVRSDGRLILWIAGLESSDRKDFSRTKIRNAVLWVVSGSSVEEEKLLRGIAANFLEGQYRQIIDQAVRSDKNDRNFEVSFKDIEKIGKGEKVQAGLPNSILKIGTNNQANLTQLANELRVASLPDNIVNLVIVTGMQSKENLIAAKVWRGLSKQIENLSLQEYTPPVLSDPPLLEVALSKAQSDTKLITALLRSKMGLFFFLLLAVYFFSHLSNFTNSPEASTPIVTPPQSIAPSSSSSPKPEASTPIVTPPQSIAPSSSSSPKHNPISTANPITSKTYSYRIKDGDSWSAIFKQCNISKENLVSLTDNKNEEINLTSNKNEEINLTSKTMIHPNNILKFKSPKPNYSQPMGCK